MRLAIVSVLICVLGSVSCTKSKGTPDANPMGGGGVGAGGSGNDAGGSQAQAGSGGTTALDGGMAGSGGNSPDGGGSGGAGAVDAPPAIADLAAKLGTGICGALLDCVGPTKLSNLVGGEDCAGRVKLELLAGEFAHLQSSLDAKRVVIDDTAIDKCVAGIKKLGCAIQSDSFPADCETAVAGKVKLGDTCTISSDCAGTAFCQTAKCPSVCTQLLAANGVCKTDDECGDDLVCTAGRCQQPGKSGADCAGTTGKVCALGWNCWGGTDTVTGTCHTNAETLVDDLNAACSPGSDICKEGLSCVWDDSSAFHCEKIVASGASCHRGQPAQCPAGEFCDTSANTQNLKDVTVAGTCKPLPGDGDTCAFPGVCKAGMVCVPDTTDTAICRPVHDNGGACKIDDACRSGYCNAAKCEAPLVCP